METTKEKDTQNIHTKAELLRIFSRGVQWEIAETEGIHKPLKEICPTDDWRSYGKYHAIAARLFNARNYGWRVIKQCETPDSTLFSVDYETEITLPDVDDNFSILDIAPIQTIKPQRGDAH
jgi:hypothetical protein